MDRGVNFITLWLGRGERREGEGREREKKRTKGREDRIKGDRR